MSVLAKSLNLLQSSILTFQPCSKGLDASCSFRSNTQSFSLSAEGNCVRFVNALLFYLQPLQPNALKKASEGPVGEFFVERIMITSWKQLTGDTSLPRRCCQGDR